MRPTRFISLVVAVMLIFVTTSSVLSLSVTYAGQSGTTQVSGLRGYVWATAAVMDAPTVNAQIHFVNICPTTSCTSWVQMAAYQGTVGVGTCPGATCVRSQTSIHMYGENTDACGNYGIDDLGAPPVSNEFYIVSYSGTSAVIDCQTQRKWYLRYGSVNNPPAFIGYLSSTTGVPQSATEIHGGDNMNTDYFGLNNTHAVSDAYGLHVLKSGSWVLWNSTNVAGSGSFQNAPPYYVSKKAFSAFQTHD